MITELTIKRSEWLHGEGTSFSKLMRQVDNKKCCLGFFCLACGIATDKIMEIGSPFYLLRYGTEIPAQLSGEELANHLIVTSLMAINDRPEILDGEREKEIAALMLRLNPPVKVTFID